MERYILCVTAGNHSVSACLKLDTITRPHIWHQHPHNGTRWQLPIL